MPVPICVYGEGQVAQPGESLAKPRPQGKSALLPAGLRGTSPSLDLETKCRKSALESFPVRSLKAIVPKRPALKQLAGAPRQAPASQRAGFASDPPCLPPQGWEMGIVFKLKNYLRS